MKQKRTRTPANDSSSSVTLLDFFATKPGTTPVQSKKRPPAKKASSASSSKPGLSRTTVQEVIVIDSDSDDSAVEIVDFVGRKRQRLGSQPAGTPSGGNSAKVESNDALILTNDVDSPFGGPVETADTHKRIFLDDNGRNPAWEKGGFGKPVLLQESPLPLDPSNSPTVTPQTAGHTNLETSIDTLPQSEDANSALAVADETACSSSTDICSIPATKAGWDLPVDIDMTLDDWGTGDDEFVEESGFVVDDDCLKEEENEVLRIDDPSCSSSTRNLASRSNAFSVLMSSFKENEAWKEASAAEAKTRPAKGDSGRRKAPFYKVLQGMPIAVDAFKYGKIPGVTAYFLTHAHSDHYTNLSSSWKHGPIYCSEGTANLIVHMLSVDRKWVKPLPMDTPTVIPDTQGVIVTLIEANHCPGSCLFLFEGRQTVNAGDTTFKSAYVGSPRTFRYLHCGDFRASPQHVLHPAVKGKVIDHVYLDTTYLDPKYTFPPQPLVVSACANLAKKLANGESTRQASGMFSSWLTTSKGKGKEVDKPTLFVIGTYSIGKERIVKAVAKAVGSKIYCEKRKAGLLRCQADPELHAMLTSDPAEAVVHLLPLGMISSDKMKEYLERFGDKYSKVVGFRPTGWTYVQPSGTDQQPSVNTILTRTVQKPFTYEDLKPNGKSTSTILMYPVPYSEHSSFYELTCFAMSLNWTKMIATVNVGSERSRGKMTKWFGKWEAERKRRGKVEVVAHRHIEYW
ncbi:DNA cross-link repair protein pso2/snm1 [Coprinopsis cinerea okayama7|uniref:DNA cross-link repair protein pso2/snm1 n=1 Tax=Coprinopsis cinerea (strain Okayama-7 / 130 / ATCC MYA-4618 / FGSC 9003) TaxID=240176 RepID=A8N9Y4_COPC7|nr:DNA cross-link repair protein pso2/snm1 [Coprinopsis cinerea okayama7\|eukprot:XP_001831640.1 DNA cross-link repair protein pso2/snm1 [Coprinopsis cinerea okayama7\